MAILSYLGRSFLILTILFGLVFSFLTTLGYFFDLGPYFVLAAAVLVVSLQYLIGPYFIDWIYRIEWTEPGRADPAIASLIDEVCAEHRIHKPRFGVIHDGNPNAFTYGHLKRDARLVVTSGLLEILDEDERKAVVAHELGHITHNDFIIMGFAALVPLIMYIIFRFSIEASLHGGKDKDKSSIALIVVAVGSFLAYVISQYIVLLLSRVREYWADSFSAHATGNPDALSSSLVKIAYGLAKVDPAAKSDRKDYAMRSLGIFDPSSARALAMSASTSGSYSTSEIQNAMYWDLWNPWGMFFELKSTHPLPAKRIRALAEIAQKELKKATRFTFKGTKTESYWDEFLVDFAVNYSPILVPLAILFALLGMPFVNYLFNPLYTPVLEPFRALAFAFLGFGLSYLIKTLYSYRRSFRPTTVKDLVNTIKVSAVRGIPCILRGKVIGRGVPGLAWSEDLVVRDNTGFLVMDYKQPLGLINFFFGLVKAGKFVGKDVEVKGWYRRAPVPYVELSEIKSIDGSQRSKCWYYPFTLGFSLILTCLGILPVLFLSGFSL